MTAVAYDTEFLEDGRTIDLISIGIIRESDGAEYYAVSSEIADGKLHDRIAAHRWLMEHVIPHLPLLKAPAKDSAGKWQWMLDMSSTLVKPSWVIANEVRDFILAADDPQLWADWCCYDHVLLCQLWGTMMQLPGGIPMWTHDLRQLLEQHGNPEVPPLGGITAHNALDVAREVMWRLTWLREHAAIGAPVAQGLPGP